MISLKGYIDPQDLTTSYTHAELAKSVLKQYAGVDLIITLEKANNHKPKTEGQWRFFKGVLYPIIIEYHLNTTGEIIDAEELHYFHLKSVWKHTIKRVAIKGETYLKIADDDVDNWDARKFYQKTEELILFWLGNGLKLPMPSGDNTYEIHGNY